VLCRSICLVHVGGVSVGAFSGKGAPQSLDFLGAPPADACPVLVRFVCTDNFPTERDMTSKTLDGT
jgi:hypothetical protein